MVDALVSVFLEKLLNTLTEESHFVTKYREQLERLKEQLLLMQSFLKDAERLKRKSEHETLRRIMEYLRELIYEAEDILVDSQSQSNNGDGGDKFTVWLHPSKLSFQYQTGKRLGEINDKIEGIKKNISSFLGVPLLNPTNLMEAHNNLMSRWSSHAYDHTQVVGLEGDTEKMKDWLFEASDGILAIGIVGMGGLGKTTLAQKVFNDRRVEDHFERRIWVSVSQTFTEEKIMRSILRSLGDACLGDDESELLKKINQYLLGKRYLIVMDDVWSEDNSWWLRISGGLPKGNGNCIIITTRNEKVARKMGVYEAKTHVPKFLSEENSWLLFRKVAFAATRGECVYKELEVTGKEIVKKCKGLPLAIKAVGGIMLCKPPHNHEWKRILKHFREELVENDNSVMASLQLSYDELPPYLKSCFLCFSLFPEDCEIAKEQLIHWWIGEYFIPLRTGRLSTEVGEDCFSELTNRCLVEVVDKAYDNEVYTCKIHDMVRDLVIRIAKDDAFSIPLDGNSRHLGITSDMHLTTNRKLRALLTTAKSGEVNRIPSNVVEKFCNCQHLHILDVSKSIFDAPLSKLLDEIGSLKHLTYLSLSNTHPLVLVPNSLEKLQKLKIFDASYCQNLKRLPSCILTYEQLAILDVSNCGSLEYLPRGLGTLSNLQVLLGFKPCKLSESRGCRIGELRSLTRLRRLSLQLSHGDEIGDDEVTALLNLQELLFLTISCFDSHDVDLVSKLDKLSPPQQLHKLSLHFYPGKISPVWLNPSSLPMLRYLSMISGNLEKMNESFWGAENTVWKIEGLKFEALSDLNADWSMVSQVMPSLKILNVSWCPELDSFPVEDAGFRGGAWKREDESS
ncbi:Disease resistance RPP13-like protein 4 [Forsythia ovata]|uniref:Disease resistance RPP13-like protein 4 n=1 Tax=Forsythia ovata TaxID=205694 RepID=A0ABD1WSZ6_9LAMI